MSDDQNHDEEFDSEDPPEFNLDFDVDLRLDQELFLEAQSRTNEAILQCHRETMAALAGFPQPENNTGE